MFMKNLVLILTLIMAGQLTTRAGAKQPPPQTDEQLRKLIVGYWLIEYKDSVGILWRGTETVALDGTFGYKIALIIVATRQDIAWDGTWQIKDGIFLETVKHTPVFHGPNAGTVSSEKIVRLDQRERVIQDKKGRLAKRLRIRSPLP